MPLASPALRGRLGACSLARAPQRQVTLGLVTFTGVVLVAAHMSASSWMQPHVKETSGPPSTAARQAHVLLWTQQRSGSTFTSRLLCASPRTFCSMEPLSHREGEGSSLLGDILKCRFSQRPVYFRNWMHGPQMNDLRVRELCEKPFDIICETPDVLEAVCRAATANIIKVVAVDLSVGAPLLQELSLTTRVIHLVRDPRALLASRLLVEEGHFLLMLNRTFFSREEKDARVVCERYRQDLDAARRLVRLYPERYTLVRYEDIARQPHTETRRLYSFMGLAYTPLVASVVSKHTLGFYQTEGKEHPFSTSKNSSGIVFAWRSRLSYSEVERVQKECGDVLRAYGYRHFSRRQYEEEAASPLLPLPASWAAFLSADIGDT
ncbi:hypothetical protein O3P69_006767 [Scylla paramamosain]|uniref:Sulfotransferase domain-containing protein n=1 Tax=Scylla paramamosain TaxID=85552 RepID=A0AAW0U147_SCYPA